MAEGLFVVQVLLCVRVLGATCVALYVLKLHSVVFRLQVGFLTMEWCLSLCMSPSVSASLCVSVARSRARARALSLSLWHDACACCRWLFR